MAVYTVALAALIALTVTPAAAQAATKPSNGAIAFSGKRAGSLAIYTRESNGAGLRVIPTAGRSSYPVFSPRGRRVAMTRYGSFGAQVWLQYTDGTGQRPLTSGPADTMPSWSPDATTIAFARDRLLVVNSQFATRNGAFPPHLPFNVTSIRIP